MAVWARAAPWCLVCLLLSCGADDRERTAATGTATDLRSSIEQLRKDALREPTSRENVYRRASVVWDWSNAMALAGGVASPGRVLRSMSLRRARSAAGS